MKLLYVAYGSNLNSKHMKKTCPAASFLGIGSLLGYRLVHAGPNGRCFLNIEKDADSKLEVGLYEIDVSEVMALDEYEEFPELYDKIDVKVEFNHQEVDAIAYVMKSNNLVYCKPKNKYFKKCLKGYEERGLDVAQLEESIKIN